MKLSIKIRRFLKKYAGTTADGDYTSPDAYQLESAAEELESTGTVSKLPWSEWGSGGYKPYSSKDGKKIHDEIIDALSKEMKKMNVIVKGNNPETEQFKMFEPEIKIMKKEDLNTLINIVKKYRGLFDRSDIEQLREIITFDRISSLDEKGYGRIVVKDKTDIKKILKYLKEKEPFEYDYIPDNYVSTEAKLIYTGKFSPDLKKLFAYCDENKIDVRIYSEKNEY
jgi:hypothetical protein